ncbi:MAG: lyase family protein, partial [Candidatus Dormibacteria bacterium]
MTAEEDRASRGRLGLFGALDTTPEMAEATSDRSWLQALLDFESALARSEALAGLIPQPAAAAIADRARAENFDLEALGRAAPAGGNPVLPLVRALADQLPRGAADWVHWGATSQDAMDSAMMLVAARACPLVLADLRGAAAAAADLAERHRRSVQVGRTLLQQAVPTTFGLKAAGWLAAISEVSETLAEVHGRRLAVQLGGAAGTLAALEQRGAEVAANLARELGLAEPLLPWHTDRVRVAQLAAALGLVAGVGAKVAIDVILLSQTEVGELSEAPGPGGGGSSAMPQKRNSAASVAIVAAQRRATPLVAVILGG